MTDRETLLLLSDARRNIGYAFVRVRKLARYDPGIAKVAIPRLNRLAARQLRLERKANIQQPPQFGWITAAIIGGSALLGLGGWIFKHHEETSLERYRLESIERCIEQNIEAGMGREQATQVCDEIFSGRSMADVLQELSRTLVIASLAITGVYLAIRWKK